VSSCDSSSAVPLPVSLCAGQFNALAEDGINDEVSMCSALT